MKIFYLGDEAIGIDKERVEWVKKTFKKEKYEIYTDGFLLDEYRLRFFNLADELLYELKWN